MQVDWLSSEVEVVNHGVSEVENLAEAWDALEHVSAVGAADLQDVGGLLDGGRLDHSLELVNEAISAAKTHEAGEDGDVEAVRSEFWVQLAAVTAEDEVASAEVEGEEPAVNEQSDGLHEEAVVPGGEIDWEHSNVHGPDDNTGARLADEANSESKQDIKDPVSHGNGDEEAPDGSVSNESNGGFENVGSEHHWSDNGERETSSHYRFGKCSSHFNNYNFQQRHRIAII